MAKNFIRRLKYIDEMLSNQELTTAQMLDQLNARLKADFPDEDFTISRRQLEKDLKFIDDESPWRDEAMSDNDTENLDPRGRKGRNPESLIMRTYQPQGHNVTVTTLKYRRKGFSIFQPKISAEEQQLLSAALSFIGQFDGIPSLSGLDMMQKRFGVQSSGDQYVSLTSRPAIADSTLLGQLYEAIVNCRPIRLHFHTFRNPYENTVRMHPYHLRCYEGRWYVIGLVEPQRPWHVRKVMNFALDRIDRLGDAKDLVYYRDPDFRVVDQYDDVVGVTIPDTPVCHIELWISDKSVNYVRTKPLHGSQKEIKKDDAMRNKYPHLRGGAFFTIDVKCNYELLRLLMSYGAELLVLSPDEIVGRIKASLSAMVQAYASPDV